MRQWNLETEELYEMAMRSAVRLLPAEFCSLPDMIRRITGIEVEAIRGMQRECQMYVCLYTQLKPPTGDLVLNSVGGLSLNKKKKKKSDIETVA